MEENRDTIIANKEPDTSREMTTEQSALKDTKSTAVGMESVEKNASVDVNKKEEKSESREEREVREAAELAKTRYGLPIDHPEMGELNERIIQRKLEKEKRNRRFRTRFYVITTSLVVLITAFIISLTGIFTVDSIEVEGNSRYTAEEIINIGHAVPGRNIIYSLNKTEIIEYLENNPYIKSADVRRRFPSTLVIRVNERTERLAVKYDDGYLVLDEEGILLRKSGNEPKITIVDGIVINKIKLGEKIGTKDNEHFKKILEMLRIMSDSDMYFVRLDMSDEDKIKAYIYKTLIVKTDYDTLKENLTNGRLHKVVESLFDKGISRGTITIDGDGTTSYMPVF